MRGRKLAEWTWLMILAVAAAQAVAQQDDVPILRPKKQAPATLLVTCDLACNWKLDGEAKGSIDAGGSAKARVELGQHALVAVADDGFDKVEKDIEIKAAGQTIFRVELQPVRNGRLQAQQDADPVYLRDHAAERAKEGQELYDQKRFEEAKPILKLACTGGEMAACVTLGTIYAPYGGLIQNDDDKALVRSLYKKACDGGVMRGCVFLGDTYNYGNDSDYNKASGLFQKACDGGDMWGCNNLATEYLFGHGEPKDRSRALDLYQRACRGGFDWACHQLSDLQYPSQ